VAKEKIILADRVHPLYRENADLWQLYLNAVKGGANFANSDNLFSHRLESSDDYTEREDRVYYLNYCETVPTLYNTYIFKENVGRAPDPNLDFFRRNTDGRGTPISDFVAKAGFFSSVFGTMHALVDMPPTNIKRGKATKRDVTRAGLQPYCTLIYPSQLKDWSFDRWGNLLWVVIESIYYRDQDPSVEREEETHYKLITRDEWRIEDEDGLPVKFEDGSSNKGPNPLGIIPLATIYHKDIEDDKVGESLLKDIVYINRAILNWCSCMDEQIERQTFSQLVVPDNGSLAEESESGDDPLHRIGTSSVWTFPADAGQPPQFISPNVENINAIWKLVTDHIKEIYRLAGLIGSSDDMYASRSGRAAQMGFLGVNAALADKAKKYQKFENDISKLAYMQLGKSIDEYQEVRYADSFDVSSLGEEIDATFKLMGENFSSTLNKTIMKNLARRAIPLASTEVRKTVENEIDSGDGLVKNTTENKQPSKEDGNPNSNLGKTFKTKEELEEEEIDKKKKEK